MTDFLAHLLRHSRGDTADLVPRLPSIFEPIADEGFSMPEEHRTQWTVEGPVPVAASSQPLLPGQDFEAWTRPVDAPHRTDAARTPLPLAAEEDGAGLVGSRDADRPAAAQENPVEEISRLVIQTAMSYLGRVEGGPEQAESPGRQQPAWSSAVEVRLRSSPAERAGDDEHWGQAARRVAGEVHRPVADRASRIPQGTAWPAPDDEPHPHGAAFVPPRPEVRAASRERAETISRMAVDPTPEPTVHVTIGRVEIRAVTAPAPPAFRQERLQAKSLDDYLTERNRRRQA